MNATPTPGDLSARLQQTARDLTEHRQTHVVWRDWLQKDPANEAVNPHAGSAEFHAGVILDYDRHLANINEAIAALSALPAASEPVAWILANPDGSISPLAAVYRRKENAQKHIDGYDGTLNAIPLPLYTTPQPSATEDADTSCYCMGPDVVCPNCEQPDAAVGAQGDDWIEQAVNRFLAWRFPDDFHPDGGISFTHITDPAWTHDNWPTGTNLLHAGQAKAMFEHCLSAAPAAGKGVDAAMVESLRELADELENAQASSHLGSLHAAGVVAGCRSAADRIRTLIGGQP